jgi:hypothetical protein
MSTAGSAFDRDWAVSPPPPPPPLVEVRI